jgi:hypothetical protein
MSTHQGRDLLVGGYRAAEAAHARERVNIGEVNPAQLSRRGQHGGTAQLLLLGTSRYDDPVDSLVWASEPPLRAR